MFSDFFAALSLCGTRNSYIIPVFIRNVNSFSNIFLFYSPKGFLLSFRAKQSGITSQSASQTALPQRHALSVCFAATSPIGRGTGVPVRPTRDEQSLSYPETVVPCYRGRQLRDNIPCQAAVDLCSRALSFTLYQGFRRPAQSCPPCQRLSLWESRSEEHTSELQSHA